jgi:hypothetical protein
MFTAPNISRRMALAAALLVAIAAAAAAPASATTLLHGPSKHVCA